MNRIDYERARQARRLAEWGPRPRCPRCWKPRSTCYCALVRPFHSRPEFVILIHRDEYRRSVATGRMAHLCLENSLLLEGTDFSEHEEVNRILADSRIAPLVLYPAPNAINLSRLSLVSPEERARVLAPDKRVVIFVIDGTWATARKMRRLSCNLHSLPVISFDPGALSTFRVRKQPRPECLSTLEAIHRVIDIWNGVGACLAAPRPHDNLLEVFASMVRAQVIFEERSGRRAVRGRR